MSKALSSKAQNFKQKAGLLTRSTPIAFPFTLFQQWQQDISVSFYELTAEEQNCRLDKEYLKKYQSVLSNRKIYMVLRAEIKFNRNMLKIIQTSPKK